MYRLSTISETAGMSITSNKMTFDLDICMAVYPDPVYVAHVCLHQLRFVFLRFMSERKRILPANCLVNLRV